jgi:hypothetical protein
VSFSFGAAGTKDETLSSLRKAGAGITDALGQDVCDLVTGLVEDFDTDAYDKPVRFTVQANGHSGPFALPMLKVSLEALPVAAPVAHEV